jgi:predicted glycosyltransferase
MLLEIDGKQIWFGNGVIKQISDDEFEIEEYVIKRLGLKEEKKEEKKKEKKEE